MSVMCINYLCINNIYKVTFTIYILNKKKTKFIKNVLKWTISVKQQILFFISSQF